MKPLLIRRSGPMERTVFIASVFIGAVAVITSVDVSTALTKVLGDFAKVYFAIMGVGGLGGFFVTQRPDQEGSIDEMRAKLRAEATAHLIIGVLWFWYGVAAATLGWKALVPAAIGISVFIGATWRVCQIRADLKKVAAAIVDPKPVDPPPLAESDEP